MKNRKKRRKAVLIAVCVAVLAAFGVYRAFYDLRGIAGEEVIGVYASPSGAYSITAYRNNGGATVDNAVLCSVTDRRSGKECNIYWQYHCDGADVVWLDEDTVQINGITLNVKTDTYDYRRD